MTTIVHLVRHGEVYNPGKILYGRLPGFHLSERGRAMAEVTAQAFQGHDVRALVSSPLTRAQETAIPFSAVTGLPVLTDENLTEAGNKLQGHRIKGWRSQLWQPSLWPHLTRPLEPSWGEPYQDILDRMWKAIDHAKQLGEGGEAILVTHQLPIVMVQRSLAGKPLAHNPAVRRCNLASVTSIVFDDDTVVVEYTEPAQNV